MTSPSTNRVTPGKIILGELGDIESGVRQLIRTRPLEVTEVALPSGHVLRVPAPDETLRIQGYLIVRRNQVRDYLDVALVVRMRRAARRAPAKQLPKVRFSARADVSAAGRT
jgi:hypothetical protein